jgi:dehydrogenase/reductase SDR family member 12
MLALLIDDLLELSIVGSFSRIGSTVRRRLFDWTAPPAGVLRGRTVLVTGPTSGLGRGMAGRLAGLGARVLLVGRDPVRLGSVRDELVAAHGPDCATAVVADMASLRSVSEAVDRIAAREPRLDVVIDNAGAMFPERTSAPDGIEATLATMVVGPFALITGLLPLLRRTGHARVVAVTSGGMYAQRLDLDDLAWARRPWNGPRAYGQAKRAQVALVREWARRVPPNEIAFNAMHPGWAETPGLAASLPGFSRVMGPLLRTAGDGADSAIWLAADPAAAGQTGRLFLDRRARPFDRAPQTRLSGADRRRLWDVVVRLANVADPAPDPAFRAPRTQPTTARTGAIR